MSSPCFFFGANIIYLGNDDTIPIFGLDRFVHVALWEPAALRSLFQLIMSQQLQEEIAKEEDSGNAGVHPGGRRKRNKK